MLDKTIKLVRPNMYKTVTTFSEEVLKGSKATRAETIYTATVTYGQMVFDADEKSMDRMARYLTIAGHDFNKALADGSTTAQAYQLAYGKTVDWILADNTKQTVTLEDLSGVYALCVTNMRDTWV